MDVYITKTVSNGKLIISDGIHHEESDERYYEYRMITGNRIPVFLSCRKSFENEKVQYVYDVTSMVSLWDLSRLKSLKSIELITLIESLSECRSQIKDYLLSPEGLILDPEYIFYDRAEKKIKYCFFPWNNIDTHSSYTKIAEFLLSAIDYSDESAVDMAYDIYASVLNKDYEFLKYIVKEEANHEEELEEMDTSEVSTDTIQNHKRISPISIISLTIFVFVLILMLLIFLFSRRLFLYIFSDIKIDSVIALALSILAYFPVMDIVSKS